MISIIIPLYNGVEFLDECLNSVYNQTFKDYEILIGLNGHEIDGKIYKTIKHHENDKLKIIQYEFVNKSKTCNELLKECKYDIICMLDVDDKWSPTKLEKQVPYIKGYDVVGTFFQYFGETSHLINLKSGEIDSNTFKNINPIINSSSMFYKKDAYWEDIFGVEDYEMWLRLNREGKRFYNVPEYLTYHRIHKTSYFNSSQLQKENLQKLKIKYNLY